MAKQPHILVIDPAPARNGLAAHLKALGAVCSVARGLHDAMVQCIIRNPAVIVADLSVPGGAGLECRRRLAELPHFHQAPFVTVGPGQDLPESASDEDVAARVRTLLPELAEAPEPAPPEAPEAEAAPVADAEPGPDAPAARALSEVLERLVRERADATLTVRGPDGAFGEVMVRGGETVHAVTAEGLAGDEALEAMAHWRSPEIEVGAAPRPETPVTVTPPAHAEAAPRRAADDGRVEALLEELEALGVVRRVGP